MYTHTYTYIRLISVHNETTSLKSLKICCTVSSCWLEYEDKEVVLTLNWKACDSNIKHCSEFYTGKLLKKYSLVNIQGRG